MAEITAAGEATVSISKPSPFKSKRSASRMSGWSSATRIRVRIGMLGVMKRNVSPWALLLALRKTSYRKMIDFFLLIPQRRQRVDFRSAPRRKITCCERDERQTHSDGYECQRVPCFDAVELAFQIFRSDDCSHEPEQQTNHGEFHAFFHDHS